MPSPHDLSFVAPERRAEVQRRIDAIERFIENPGRKAAEAAAAELGLRVAQFYNLVRAWKPRRLAQDILGSGAPRNRRSSMSDEQLRLVETVVAEHGTAKASEITNEILARAQASGLAMPARANVVREVRKLRPPRINTVEGGSDILVDHTVLELPVDFGSGETVRPLLTAVIDARTSRVIGTALSAGTPDTAVIAAALQDALARCGGPEADGSAKTPSICITVRSADDIADLLDAFDAVGVAHRVSEVSAHGGGLHIDALFGNMSAGLRLRHRLVWITGARRSEAATAARPKLYADEALDLVRARLVPEVGESALRDIPPSTREGLSGMLLKLMCGDAAVG